MARTEPFTSHDWRLFSLSLRYIDRTLDVAFRMATGPDPNPGRDDISTQVIGVRVYVTELGLLQSLLYRAAGERSDEQECADAALGALYRELEKRYPELRSLRNALFAHPPFVEGVIGDHEVLMFTEHGVFRAPVEGGAAHAIVEDPLLAHPWVEDLVERFRDLISRRHADAVASEGFG